jgi:thiol-disulfide isomerase/thioredoxin
MRIFWVLLAIASMGSGMWLSARINRPPESIPEPLLVDLQGFAHSLSDWRGKILIVNFWATWCEPCREEMKTFSAVQAQAATRGVQFVGVALDDAESVRAYLRLRPVNYPILLGDAAVTRWSDQLGNELQALPFTVIFDSSGAPKHRRIGLFKAEELLRILRDMGVALD